MDENVGVYVGIVINGSYGGLYVSTNLLELLGIDTTLDEDSIALRTHPKLVKYIEDNDCSECDGLEHAHVEYIPKKAIDLGAVNINEYDGNESVSIDEFKMRIYRSLKTICEMEELIKLLPECEHKKLLHQKIKELRKELGL
jgi:hypothetical protein